jgi:hypothetical protein
MNNYTSFLSKYKDLERNRKAVLDEICSIPPGGKYPYKNYFSRDEDEYLTWSYFCQLESHTPSRQRHIENESEQNNC